MDVLVRDVRYALRTLTQAPGFTITAVLTFALGIGANIAIFSIVYAVLLKGLAYRDPDRLLVAHADVDYEGAHRPVPMFIQPTQFGLWQSPLPGIESVALYSVETVALSGSDGSEALDSAVVSESFFSTLEGPLAAGRGLGPADDYSPVVVVSERLALRLFGAARDAVGRQIILSTHTYTVLGVASPSFQFPDPRTDAWMPAGYLRSINARCCGFRLIARLAGGEAIERARAAVTAVFERSVDLGRRPSRHMRIQVVRLHDDIVAAARPALWILFTSVIMVLVVACSNVANLLLARNARRGRELAVRRALGASRGRLIRQFLTESAMLATAGTMMGVLFAAAVTTTAAHVAGDAVPRIGDAHLNVAVLLFAAAMAACVAAVTGIIPAIRAVDASGGLKDSSPAATPPRHGRRLERTLCVAQVAIAMILLIGASLLARSLVRLLHVDIGVSTAHVLTASMNLAQGQRPTDQETLTRVDRIVQRIRAVPGVRVVGVGTSVPPSLSRIQITLRRQGDAVDYAASAVASTPGYFAALQARLLAGRFFTEADDAEHPQVMIMSEDTARRFFGSTAAIGRAMSLPALRNGKNTSVDMTLVGIIANVKYSGLSTQAGDAVYRPFAQQPWVAPFLVVRTIGDPLEFASTLRREIGRVDRGIVTSSVETLDDRVAADAAQPRFRTVLLVSLAGLALAIAAVGLSGVIAYTVSHRTREIGIRMALGATSGDVLRMVMRDGLVVALGGLAAGFAGALVVTRTLATLLFGVTPTDALSFATASAALLLITLVASYLPARRAARVDPMVVLRAE